MERAGRQGRLMRLSALWLWLCLGLVPTIAAAQEAVTPAQDELKLQDKFFDSSGVKIRYVDLGSGDPVILLHGNGGSLEEWVNSGMLQSLERDFRVIAFDARGHGKSDKPHDPKAYGREMSLDVLRLMDHLGLQKAHLIGYSMGAQTVAHLITIAPERFASATLGGAPGRFYWTEKELQQAEQNAVERERDCISRGMIEARAPIGAPPMSDEEFKRRSAACFANKSFDRFALAAVGRGQATQTITRGQACAVKVPLLGVVGTLDGYLPYFRELKACLPDMQLLVLEGASHGTAARRPEFIATARAFLMTHRLASSK
jgi:pimeloyl-ACP methyl ester carboxylesterase